MKISNELIRMHEEITRGITEENHQEMAVSIAEKSAAARAAEAMPCDRSELEAMGVNIAKLDALEQEQSEISNGELEATIANMDELSQLPVELDGGLDVSSALLPPDTFKLEPSWSAVFSDEDQQDSLISAQSTRSRNSLGCRNLWNSAKGGGGGCIGGVGSISSHAEFGFWFRPAVTKFYSIRPLFRFRGYYIVKANDKWYNCKHAKSMITVETNCYQYNWKGWNSVNVLNERGGNINRNRRFDIDRHTNNTYLLAGGDWAFIRARIKLHARAQGGGSYVKNDFSTGAANYLCVPHIHVF